MKQKLLLGILAVILTFQCFGCSNKAKDKVATPDEAVTTIEESKIEVTSSSRESLEETTIISTTSEIENTTIEETPEQYTYEESKISNTSYESYIGLWRYSITDDLNDGMVQLGIHSINEDYADISFSKISPNYAHIIVVMHISALVTNENRLEFSFTDNFANKCSGYAELKDNSIYLKIDVDEWYDPLFGSNVDVTLDKMSNKVSKEDFI